MYKKFLLQVLALVVFAAFAVASSQSDYDYIRGSEFQNTMKAAFGVESSEPTYCLTSSSNSSSNSSNSSESLLEPTEFPKTTNDLSLQERTTIQWGH